LARERFVPISEDYDLGHVEAGYRDLHDLRERAYQQLTQRVTPGDADFTLTRTIDAPPAEVYAEIVRPSTMQRLAGAPNITLKNGARGTLANAAYHCEHGRTGRRSSRSSATIRPASSRCGCTGTAPRPTPRTTSSR